MKTPRMLGIDYGEKRVGFALCEGDIGLATGLRGVEVRSDRQAVEAARQIVNETKPERVVVGLPINMDGSSGHMVAKVTAFVEALAARVSVPVVTWDERLSSRIVERALVEGGVNRQKRREVRDKLAAQAILQGYLDAMAEKTASQSPPESWSE